MKQILQQLAHLVHGPTAWQLCAAAAGLAVLAIWLVARERQPAAEEIERRRCERLVAVGRITDGVIVESGAEPGAETRAELAPLALEGSTTGPPRVLVYTYRIAGVTYQCAQDISRMMESPIRECSPGLRELYPIAGQSVQVRYDPHNPGDSMVVSEAWSGLWSREGK